MIRLFTLAYASLEMVEQAIDHYKRVLDYDRSLLSQPVSWHLVDCGWPLPSKPDQSRRLRELSDEHRIPLLQTENRGVHENWNFVIQSLGCSDDDVFIGLDPDERPERGFIRGVSEVLLGDPEAFYCAATPVGADVETYRRLGYAVTERTINRVNCFSVSAPAGWPVGGFSGRWINRLGGIHATNPKYGYIESEMFARARAVSPHAQSMFLSDVKSRHLEAIEPLYTRWKLESAQHKTQEDFERWLGKNYVG